MLEVQTEVQTIAELVYSINPEVEETENTQAETDSPVDTKVLKKETETSEDKETGMAEPTDDPQNEEMATAVPVDPSIELESKPTDEALDNEDVEQKDKVEAELKVNDPENERENDTQQNDQESIIEPVLSSRTKAQIDSIVAHKDPNESESSKLAESIDQKDADIAMRAVDHTNGNQVNDDEIKSIVLKYFQSVPDMNSEYVLNEGLAKSITHYFKNKVVALPLFNINMKIDRNLVKIPWETGQPREHKKNSYPYSVLPGLNNKT